MQLWLRNFFYFYNYFSSCNFLQLVFKFIDLSAFSTNYQARTRSMQSYFCILPGSFYLNNRNPGKAIIFFNYLTYLLVFYKQKSKKIFFFFFNKIFFILFFLFLPSFFFF